MPKAKSLVIVESPVKAKTINKFLGSGYVVKPTGGHLIDLPENEIGIDLENGFIPKYRIIKGKKRIVQELKKTAEGVDTVYLATDPDREGEAIAWHVANSIAGKNQALYRVMINQITKDAVLKAIENKGELDMQKVDAQQARRVLDRLVGYKVSPVLWKTIYKGLSAGRVQSVALRLIVERDQEIEAFVPEEYWIIKALLASEKNEEFEVKLIKKNGEAFKIKNSEESEAVVREISSLPFNVKDVSTNKTKRNPSPPFITSTFQQEASRRRGFNVYKTMRVAQSLYEGVELGEGSVGLITYMRTDSTRIAPEALGEARNYIKNKWGSDHLPSKANIYRTKKSAQDAHEAIRPASLYNTPEKVKHFLTPDQFKLYSLIWNRFVASQMKPAEYTVVTIDVAAGPYELRSTSKHLDYQGFLMVYKDIKDVDEDDETSSLPLPAVKKGDVLILRDVLQSQHFTKPPPFYNEASLVRELEARGIGRPSTYAQIINTIQTRKYVDREKGKLVATELGKDVNKILVSNFPDVFSVGFTANMEEELDKIESGEYEWQNVVDDFYGPFNESLEKIKGKSGELKKSLIETTDEKCEKCERPMVIRWGRNGKFLACSGFPECKNTKPLEEPELQTTDVRCDKCGSLMHIKTGRYGRFLACSNYPKCRNIKPFSLDIKCPEEGCDGDVVERKTKKGKIFYGCSRYPDCAFASWNKPVAEKCRNCESPTLIEAKSGKSYYCPRCKNKFET
ncbi:type I DNA topoisomerase [Candidatus Latescibacterota bacterium]